VRVLALDVGDKRIGTAISDPSGTLATALGVMVRKGLQADVQSIARLADQEGAEFVLVGNPLGLSGEETHQSRRVARFVQGLRGGLTLPVELWDERYSTVDADSLLAEVGVPGPRRRHRLDAWAAGVFLQRFLDSRKEPHA
jgi:putative holliday junction resolvase